MSRYCYDYNATQKINAATIWRDQCLLGNGSVFTDENIWIPQYLDDLTTYFVNNVDTGEGAYYEKLSSQLEPASPQAKKLAAEMHWFMFLCPGNISIQSKKDGINQIWSWSGDSLNNDHQFLADDVLDGIGSAGVGFNLNRWRELVYFIKMVTAFKQLSSNEQNDLLAESWVFAEWVEAIPDGGSRQLRNMLVFLLFPDDFERIFGGQDRIAIVSHFKNLTAREVHNMSQLDIDRALLQIRHDLEIELDTQEIDFYLPDIVTEWRPQTQKKPNEPIYSAGIPLNITRENVLQALEEVDRDGVLASAQSTTYDLMHNEKYYPPKYVLSLANKYANGEILDRNSFEGGEDTPAFSILRDLGFEIERKDFHGYFLKRFIVQANAEVDLTTRHYLRNYRNLNVKVSFGQGVFARIPWISLLAEGQTTSHGIYPVFLYYKALGVLVLAKGISETEKPHVEWKNIDSSETVNDYLVRLFNTTPDRYGDSYVYKAYKVNNGVIEGNPVTELDKLIDEYNILINGAEMPEPPVTPLADPVEIVSDFTEKLRISNIDFGSQHENRVRTFVASLLTKPFVILTGLSGSGKTQIAIRFGEWLGDGRLHVAAVRPDWTGAEALFGYEDALRPAKEGRAAWAVPKPLEFILKAVEDPQNPYVLLLDEMNLAHVERYFADVLSGMESGQPCIPNLAREADSNWRVKPNSPDQIVLPNNVFVIGTVNVDETTYMFSPKVLDRANTFEFRVSTEDLADHYLKPEPCEAGSPELIQGFLEIAKDSDWHNNQAFSESDKLSEELRNIHRILSPYSFEFGHRVYYEAQRFASIYEAAGSATLEDALDRILIQKILPRLHGSRRRLESLIKGLAHYCYDLSMPSDETGTTDVSFDPENKDVANSSLPNSFEKLTRMLRSLRANQFTSFTE